jgi:hypothetical protein
VNEQGALWSLVNGYRASQALVVAVSLGVADLLADGSRSSAELAAGTGSHEPSLYRLLRALASLGVLAEGDDRRFSLTPLGEPLRSDVPESLAAWIRFSGREYHRNAWMQLEHSVRTGDDAMHHTIGRSSWEYRAEHPEEGEIFDRAMTDLTRTAVRDLVAGYDFKRFGTVVDVGGGHGSLLAGILSAAPEARGVLFDLPQVLAGARPLLEGAGVFERCELVAGSFFDSVPAGGDAYTLKSIVHDWDDADATRILSTCRAAMGPGARVLLVERDLGAPNELPGAKLSDLNMLVALGGRERTRDEYAALFERSGLSFVAETPTPSGFSVYEAAPAQPSRR